MGFEGVRVAEFLLCFTILILCSTDRTPLENCLDRGRASRGGEHDCVITRIFDNDDLSYPHIGYAMIEDADLTDRLLWSEVYSAACFMARRLLLTEYKMHQFAPVGISPHLCHACANMARFLLSRSLVRKPASFKRTLIPVSFYKNPKSLNSERKITMASSISYAG